MMNKISRIPLGLRIFYHPASFILVAVATATASSSRLAGLIKSLATRLKDIVAMGSELLQKSEGFALFVGTTGSADSMDIIIVCCRQVIVDNMTDIGNIKTPGSNVCRYQNLNMAILEHGKRLLPAGLSFITMNRFGFKSASGKSLRETLYAMLCSAENKHLTEL